MAHTYISLEVGPGARIEAHDNPSFSAPYRVVTLLVEDMTLHLGGRSDRGVVLVANRLIAALIELREAAQGRLTAEELRLDHESTMYQGEDLTVTTDAEGYITSIEEGTNG